MPTWFDLLQFTADENGNVTVSGQEGTDVGGTIISQLPSHDPIGTDVLAVENSSVTGKATVDDIVAAASVITTINNKIGSTSMGTTATTITGAIAEHESDITALNGYIGNIRYDQYAVSGGSSQNVTLATWAVYLVSTYQGFHVVFTGSSSSTPVISTVQNNSSLPVTGASNAKIVLQNTTGATYQFSVIRIL